MIQTGGCLTRRFTSRSTCRVEAVWTGNCVTLSAPVGLDVELGDTALRDEEKSRTWS